MKAELKPAEIADRCQVTSNSIRNWSKEFRAYLSPGANAPERFYTAQDATVLQYISTLKQEGMKTPEIIERLAETTFGDIESPEIVQEEPIDLAAQPAAPEWPGMAEIIKGYIDSQNAIERRLAAVEASRSDAIHPAYYIALGAVGALVLVAILIGLAVLYGGVR